MEANRSTRTRASPSSQDELNRYRYALRITGAARSQISGGMSKVQSNIGAFGVFGNLCLGAGIHSNAFFDSIHSPKD